MQAAPRVGHNTTTDLQGTNFPKDAEGRVYHLVLKAGDIANRILVVGDPDRAKLVKSCLDNPDNCFESTSNRGFTTYTGKFRGVPVTIMSTGMGYPMMDFAVREIRAITEGPIAIIRLGSCGTPNKDVAIGTVAVSRKSTAVSINYDGYSIHSKESPFKFSLPIGPTLKLHDALLEELSKSTAFPTLEAPDVSADTFYGSQGRIDPAFRDENELLADEIMHRDPTTASLQMETYHLYFLSVINNLRDIHVAACSIVLANRKTDEFISMDKKHTIEVLSGNACLRALVNYQF
jgi:uridine phosphorylase